MSSRIRINRLPLQNAARAIRAVSSGTGSIGDGRIDIASLLQGVPRLNTPISPNDQQYQYCRVIHRLRQPWLTTLQTKVPRVTRPIFTSPGPAGWFGIALGFSSCFAPDDYSSRTRRR